LTIEEKSVEQPRVRPVLSNKALSQLRSSLNGSPITRSTPPPPLEKKEEETKPSLLLNQKSEKITAKLEIRLESRNSDYKLKLQRSNPDLKAESKKDNRNRSNESRNERNERKDNRLDKREKEDWRSDKYNDWREENLHEKRQEKVNEKDEKNGERKEEERGEKRNKYKGSESKPPIPQNVHVSVVPAVVESQQPIVEHGHMVIPTSQGWAIMNPSSDLQQQERKKKGDSKRRTSLQNNTPVMQPMITVQPMMTQSGHMVLVTENGLCVPATADMFQYQQWYDSVNQESHPSYYYNSYYANQENK
jgi:hypothetical protein